MSAAVNHPTIEKQKEADLNRKLQLFGIYSAFEKGKAPSNKQIDVAMNSALASKPLANPSNRLSDEGKVLVADLRDVIEKAKVMLLTKNEGNLIQDFIWQCQSLGTGDATKPNVPVSKDEAKQHGQEALEGLRTLGTLIITNGQFRKLLNDALIILRDIAGDGAQKAADRVNPSEDQLAQIDQPAADNTWHDSPDFKGMKDKAKEQYQNTTSQLKAGAQSAADSAKQADTAEGAAQNAQANASAQLSEEDKRIAREKKEKAVQATKDYLGEKMPKERREQAIWRLKKMIVEVQGHQDYQRAIDTLLRLAETYGSHGKAVGADSAGTVKGAHSGNDGLNNAEADLKILIERFANSTSMDDLFDAINQIYRDAEQDPELKAWFRNVDTYIRKCLKEQGYVMQDAANEEGNRLYDQGNFLLRERYKNHTDRVIEEIKFLADQFDQDPANQAFARSMEKLFKDLGNDREGKPTFKPHLLKDLSNVILPAFFESIHYIPIPRIEYSDSMADAVIENLVIEGDNLAPNVFEFGSDNYWRWGRKKIASKNKNKVMVSVSGIQMDLRNVSYYIKKKEGFPSITDMGVMDIFLGGSGFSFKIAMETADTTDRSHFFKVNNVTVDIKHMNIKLKQSKYKLLFGLVKPLLIRVMNPILQKVIAKQITDQVSKLDEFCYEIHQQAQQAEADAKRNKTEPENLKNVYQYHWEAYQKKMTEVKQKKEAAKAKTEEKKGQTNVAMTQHDSMFPQIKLPGGVSTKATEYRDLANKGEKWESPVFSLGSAGETRGLPKVQPVTRKPHNTTTAEVKSPQSSTLSPQQGSIPSQSQSGTTFASTGSSDPRFASSGTYNTYSTTTTSTTEAGYGAGQGTSANLAETLGHPQANGTTKVESSGPYSNPVLSSQS